MNQEREAVARIVDHLPFEDNWTGMPGTKMGRRDAALAKADAILALRSGGEGWRPIGWEPQERERVIAGRWHDGEWVADVVYTPLSYPFTHWMPLPPSPSTHGEG